MAALSPRPHDARTRTLQRRDGAATRRRGVWRVSVTAAVAASMVLGGVVDLADAAPPPEPPAIDLGTLGGSYGSAIGVTPSGMVVGTSTLNDEGSVRAFVWTRTDGMVALGTLGGDWSESAGYSDAGHVVGSSTLANGRALRAFLWTREDGMVNLGTLGRKSHAVAVNDAGVVAGYYVVDDPSFEYPFVWTRDGGMVALGGTPGEVAAVNGDGQVVGSRRNADGEMQAFSWTPDGGMVELDGDGFSGTYATDVNGSGQILGRGWNDEVYRALLWSPSGERTDLGTLGGPGSIPADINDAGQVVGGSDTADGANHAFLWSRSGDMIDLGTIGAGRDSFASAVNEHGRVVGEITEGEVFVRAFTWTEATGMVGLGSLNLDGSNASAGSVNDDGIAAGSASVSAGGLHAVIWDLGAVSADPPTRARGALVDLQPAVDDPTDGARVRVKVHDNGRGTTARLHVWRVDRAAAGRTLGAHIHVGPCVPGDGAAAGPHYNAGGPPSPTTEVWLDVTINARGHGRAVTRVPFVIPDGAAASVVVHEQATAPDGNAGARLACIGLPL